jgi:hypothetical protein
LKRWLYILIFLLFATFVHVLSLGKAADAMKQLSQGEDYDFVLPSPIVKIAALEFQGLASDVLFLKSIVFMGSTFDRKEKPRIKDWEWKWLLNVLDTSTDLDPYFFDPYFIANAFLTWDAGKIEETNRLLEKGSRYRDWDWMLPFYIGFNNFFFLQDDDKAAEFLFEASRRPGGTPSLASLASRLAFKGNRTETAILFLEELVTKTDDTSQKKQYETRIKALRSILILEKAISLYKNKVGRVPSTFEELVEKNILRQLPQDPYGGTYYITQNGRVKSTRSSELEPYLSPFQKPKR